MTDVSTITQATTASTASQDSNGNQGTIGTALTSDFETFLLLLTTQAENQDPLEPIDSTEYASQLAQFSMVEQQVMSNTALSALTDHLALQNANNLASWVGMEVRAKTPAYFDGEPISINPAPDSGADRADLIVKDEAGNEVQRYPLPSDPDKGVHLDDPVIWGGHDDEGNPLANGIYSFSVESFSEGKSIGTSDAQVYTRVTEAQFIGGDVALVTKGGLAIGAAEVTAIRQ